MSTEDADPNLLLGGVFGSFPNCAFSYVKQERAEAGDDFECWLEAIRFTKAHRSSEAIGGSTSGTALIAAITTGKYGTR